MRKLAFSVVAALTLGCSSGGGGSAPGDGGPGTGLSGTPDPSSSGRPAGTLNGQVAIKNLGFSGDLRGGQFTFVIENGKENALDAITELKLTTTVGDLVFSNPCTSLATGSPLRVLPGSTSSVIKMVVRKSTGPQGVPMPIGVTMPCASTPTMETYSKSKPELSDDDKPISLTLAGILSDASPWTASGTLE
jgi:hypothetical protein